MARAAVAALVLLTASASLAAAQQAISTGTITGIVQDEQGLPIPGALVEVTNVETQEKRSTTSNDTGIFNVPALVIGRYKVSVSLSGFGTVERVDIRLQSNEVYNAGTPFFIKDPLLSGACSPTAGGPGCFPNNIRTAVVVCTPMGSAVTVRVSVRSAAGDSPLNNIRQPGNYNLDLSMSKTFALGRGQRLMFRADAYNALKVNTRTVNIAAQFDPQGRQINSDFGRLALCRRTKRARLNYH